MEWYYLVGAVAYGIFVIQFILSWVGGDLEADVDLDGDADLSISDIVSFKGFIHFLMGCSSWLILKSKIGELLWYDYLIAAVLGLLFMIILYYIYKLFMKLECKPKILEGQELVGRPAEVYIPMGLGSDGYYKYAITCDNNNGIVELYAKSANKLSTGDLVTIQAFVNNYYLI